ncbi:lantibiotic dehydratase [Streptomyces pinistramenti]|uniref:lantibiotic dehydratase n=1 Tax=Streptomyces pinistramenti TaxID=2884812 RepID=UPI001D062663|nr:lantibiotic dehydratase [Streptomyces pinistramenti]MCB5908613.1 lantibiotic dehydratase [Streptomyces pinistramenti]
MSQQSYFQAAGIGMLRAPVHPVHAARLALPAPDPGADEAAGLTAALRTLAADPLVREAVEVSSPSLAGLLRRVLDAGQDASLVQLRRAVRALASYRLRMSTRATPFGLMAGVAPVRFAGPGEPPKVRFGAAHRRVVRPDREWLTGLVAAWERRPGVLHALHVVANALCRVRGGRLVLPYVPQSAQEEGADGGARTVQEVSLRHSAVVAAVLELARRPVSGAELAQKLLARFPGATAEAVDGVLVQLVGKEILLTDARPPLEETDPLGHVLRVCAGVSPQALPERAELIAIQEELAQYAASPLGGGAALEKVTARMRGLYERPDLLQVDLALDAEARLPAGVAEEAARAADLLWRLAPDTAGPEHLREYHLAFLKRYGTDRLVPLTELLDPDTGLGAPAGYRRPPSPRTAPPATPDAARDRVLAELAQQALLTGESEVVLHDDHPAVRLLAKDGGRPPESREVGAHLLAADTDALARGDFRLVPANGSRQAGALLGRFGYLLGEGADAELAALVRAEDGDGHGDSLRAQVAFRPGRSRVGNVAQVPQWLDRLLPVGCFADPDDPTVLDPRHLSVRADRDGLQLADAATGRRVDPAVFHMLNPKWDLPNAARFVCEITASGRRRWQMWHWGGAEILPHLPRVRYGRTVLSPARWRPDTPLRAAEPSFAQWWETFRDWQQRWRVPDRVQVGWADRFVSLDLTLPGHPQLLRHELLRTDQAELRETPADAAGLPDGWLHGPDGPHHAEVVIPLRSARTKDPGPRQAPPAAVPAPRRPAPARPPGTVHLPGGEWLQVCLYTPAERHEELLAAHLPPLLGQLPDQVDRWFFLRYEDAAGPHLRLRFHAPQDVLARDLLPLLHERATALHTGGLTGRVVWDSYDPELERYGGPEAMAAAERVFHADSVAVLEHLRRRYARQDGTEPLLLAAAGFADLARAFHLPAEGGEADTHAPGRDRAQDLAQLPGGAAWLLRTIPKDEELQRTFRRHRRQALPLVDPYRAGPGPAADAPLRALWDHRAEETARYGHLLRGLGSRSWSDPDHVLSSLLHMHHNRLTGADRDAERLAHAVARGATQAHTDRIRHTR